MSLLEINEEIMILYNLYDDKECRDKLLEFIQKDLNEKMLTFWERRERQENLKKLSDNYINDFLVNNDTQYFYIHNSEIFISYNGETFKSINESEILHQILTGISKNKSLLPWKQKVKTSIMKIIKEKNIFDIIPESHTIQYVLDQITPLLLQTKNEAKYFLTILGDNILKKNTELFHIVNNRSKDFITTLEENVYHNFKNYYHINNTFKFNWHDHEYKKCRVLNFNKTVKNSSYWRTFIKYHILDIMSVAVHYSKRYGNSDEYILSKKDEYPNLKKILFLSTTTKKEIVNEFINKAIVKVNNKDVTMSFNEIMYVWKLYLLNKDLPNVIFQRELKELLNDKLSKNEEDNYIGITSPYDIFIKNLHHFWRENITLGDNEFEISEICDIYKLWLKENKTKIENLEEDNILTLIKHFFKCEIEDNKIVKNINCKLWDKIKDMKTVISDIKISYNFSPGMFNKSIQSIYEEYCTRAKNKFNFNIVSKKYFEKYITKIIPKKYLIGRLISNEFWIS